MAITTKGITYPTSSDNIAPLETHFANLASTADNAGVIAGKEAFTGPATTGAVVDVVVAQAFASAPYVVASVQGPSGSASYAVTILGAPTTSGFTARVYKLSGSSAESLNLVWHASTYTEI
jgi:hypothetical protein